MLIHAFRAGASGVVEEVLIEEPESARLEREHAEWLREMKTRYEALVTRLQLNEDRLQAIVSWARTKGYPG